MLAFTRERVVARSRLAPYGGAIHLGWFQLTKEEFDSLRSHIATSNERGGRRYQPYMSLFGVGLCQGEGSGKVSSRDTLSRFAVQHWFF